MSKDVRVKSKVEHSIEFDGSKYVSGQMVHCAEPGCEETCRVANNNFSHRLPDEVLRKVFQKRGWVFKNRGWFCPDHAHSSRVGRILKQIEAEPPRPLPIVAVPELKPLPVVDGAPEPIQSIPKETTPMPSVQPTPIKSFADLANAAVEKMSQSDHRRIFREIDENWDDNRGRYTGDTGDQQIAARLNVPRAWVEYVRKEAFGDSAGSEEIEELREEMLALDRKYAVAEDDALKLATRMETLHREHKALLVRLERVEQAVGVRR